MTKVVDKYNHLLVCIERLNAARNILKQIEIQNQIDPSHPLVGPAFRYALVEYATAFTGSKIEPEKVTAFTKSREKRNEISLSKEEYVPPTNRPLHERIFSARNKVHAHADVSILEPELEVHDIGGEPQIARNMNHISGLEELRNLPEIVELIEVVLRKLYNNRDNSQESVLEAIRGRTESSS